MVWNLDEIDEKWLYKQEHHGSRETIAMNKDLKHDSALYSYDTLNRDSQGYLNNGTKDTNGYPTHNDGYLSNSSSSTLYSSRKQSSSYSSRSFGVRLDSLLMKVVFFTRL